MVMELKAFQKAKKLADNGCYAEAYPIFEVLRASDMNNEALSNRVESYYGICLAMARKQTREGLTICKLAAQKEMFSADVFLNLGKLYSAKNSRGKAYDAYMHGLKMDESDVNINRELDKVGRRRPPAIRFLSRSNIINVFLGKLRGKK